MGDGFSVDLGPIIDARVEEIVQRTLTQLDHRQAEQWPEWMAPATGARYIDVTPVALQHMKDRGVIPFHQEAPGCSIRYRRGDLDAYMAEQRVEARRSS